MAYAAGDPTERPAYRSVPSRVSSLWRSGKALECRQSNTEAACFWISGLEAVNRALGRRASFDLAATPSFLRGSGYDEGTLCPGP